MADKKLERARAEEASVLALVHSGWLSKKGGFRTNWQKRWFEVRGTVLLYKEKEVGPPRATSCEACILSRANMRCICIN